MSWPLNAHEKDTSRAGSKAIWQGSTVLSPTIISVLVGLMVILVGSVQTNGGIACKHYAMLAFHIN